MKRIIWIELLDQRVLLSAAFDVTHLTDLRDDSTYSNIDGSGVGIAILDTGIYASNPSLSSNVVAFYNAVTSPVPTTISSSSVSSAFDEEGHGTHVAGTAASSDPDIGVAYAADIISIHVLPDQGESQLGGDPILRGLQFVAQFADQYNIKVVNMSLGESTSNGGVNLNSATTADDISRAIDDLEALGITVVSASGNSYANDPEPGASYPAVVSTISVGSTWSDTGSDHDFNTVSWGASTDNYAAYEQSAAADRFSATSQRSTMDNQVAAPGVDIYSTWNNSSSGDDGSDLLHNTLSGTSMASPFVSGLVALMQDAAFTYGGQYITDVSEVLQIIKDTADVITDSNVSDNGRVPLNNGSPDTSQTLNLPETGDTFYRVNVLNAIEKVRQLFGGTAQPGEDTNNLISTAGSLPDINGTRQFSRVGNIGSDGLVDVGADDVDLYKLVLNSPGSLSISLAPTANGTSFSASLRIFDASGNQVARVDSSGAGNYPTLTTDDNNPLAIGTYYVGVSSLSNVVYSVVDGSGAIDGLTQGDYTLTVSLSNPDPNGVAQGAAAVDMTAPDELKSGATVASNFYQGVIGSDPPAIGSATRVSVPDGDVDMFKVVAPDTGTLTVDIDALSVYGFNAVDSYVVVLDANLNQIAANDDQNYPTNTDSFVQVSVTIGQTYYVAVTNYDNRTFDPSDPYGRVANSTATEKQYNLYLSFDNGDTNGTAIVATTKTIGATVTDAVGKDNGAAIDGAQNGFKDVDFTRYVATSSGYIDLKATSTTNGFSPALTLWKYDSTNATITQIGSTSGSTAELIYAVNAGDVIYASVTGQGNSNFNWFAKGSGTGGQTGSYTLASSMISSSAANALSDDTITDSPTTLTAGNGIYGNLGNDDALIVGDTDVDLYKFVPTTSGRYDFRTDTSQEGSADTVLRVFDASGNEISSNDNQSSSTTSSFVRLNLIAGQTYYVGVSGTGNKAYNAVTGSGTATGSTGDYGISVVNSTQPVISVTPVTINEPETGTTVATFTITLDTAAAANVTVAYATSDGTAIAGSDYTATSGTLTFAPGETSKTIEVPILSDTIPERDETFTLTLSNPSTNAILGVEQVAGTIHNEGVTFHTLTKSQKVSFLDIAGNTITAKLTGRGEATIIEEVGKETSFDLTGGNASTSVKFTAPAGASIGAVTIGSKINKFDAGNATLKGAVNVAGAISNLSAAGVTDASIAIVGSIGTFDIDTWINSDGVVDTLTATRVKTLKVKNDLAANVSVEAISSLSAGSISGATITATDSISKLRVANAVGNSLVSTDGAMGSVIVGSAVSSKFFAGVSDAVTDLPDSSDDFVSQQTITSFKVTSKSADAFSDSDVAAWKIKSATLGLIDTDNADDVFGVSAQSLKQLARTDALTGKPVKWKLSSAEPAPSDGDYVTRIVA